MSEHHADRGSAGGPDNAKIQAEAEAARAKQQAAEAQKAAEKAAREAEEEQEKVQEEQQAKADDASDEQAEEAEVAEEPAEKETDEATADEPEQKAEPEEEPEVVEEAYVVKAKPELDDDTRAALRQRNADSARRPAFRRQEWFRYKKLGGKDAGWRRPRGIHSKMRRHFKYRPNVASIGFRGPAAARGLHPSGFEEVLVYRPEDLEGLDGAKQAARVGGTVGGRKAAAIESKADEMGIRILNRRN